MDSQEQGRLAVSHRLVTAPAPQDTTQRTSHTAGITTGNEGLLPRKPGWFFHRSPATAPWAVVVTPASFICRTRGAQIPLQRLQERRVLAVSFLLLILLRLLGLPHAQVAPSDQDCQSLA